MRAAEEQQESTDYTDDTDYSGTVALFASRQGFYVFW